MMKNAFAQLWKRLRTFFTFSQFLSLVILLTLVVFVALLFIRTGSRPTLVAQVVGTDTTTQTICSQVAASGNSEGGSLAAGCPDSENVFSPPGINVEPASFGKPWSQYVDGLLTFRGNPTRSYYGKGPVPLKPRIEWTFPSFEEGPLCSTSNNQEQNTELCGIRWTGQPTTIEREGKTWLIFGSYDGSIHFLDADTGERLLPDFKTGDTIGGSLTLDPDGFPLIYFGSRDNFLRVVSIDGSEAREIWKLDAESVEPRLWGTDWDSAPLVLEDYLLAGGENSNFHIIKLNRRYGPDGKVDANPELVHIIQGWDGRLIEDLGDTNVSIESSPVVYQNTLYFGNSGGLIQGWDLSKLHEGEKPERTFAYWAGGDVDSTIVADALGKLYVGVERDRSGSQYRTAEGRTRLVGQIIKLDPDNPENPLVWSVFDEDEFPSGVRSTLALHEGVIYATTQTGRLIGIDSDTGTILWERQFRGQIMSSPVIVNDILLAAVPGGQLKAYDLTILRSSGQPPEELWSINLGGSIEATPAVWGGKIFLGTTEGRLFGIGEIPRDE